MNNITSLCRALLEQTAHAMCLVCLETGALLERNGRFSALLDSSGLNDMKQGFTPELLVCVKQLCQTFERNDTTNKSWYPLTIEQKGGALFIQTKIIFFDLDSQTVLLSFRKTGVWEYLAYAAAREDLYDSFPAMVLIHDPGGNVQSCNRTACDYLRIPRPELLGQNVFDYMPPPVVALANSAA